MLKLLIYFCVDSYGCMHILQVQVADIDWIKIVSQEEISVMVRVSWLIYFVLGWC